jgi:hypothetical protein
LGVRSSAKQSVSGIDDKCRNNYRSPSDRAKIGAAKLAENIRAFVDAVNEAKPAGAKGAYLKRLAISPTMGPGVKLDLSSVASPSAAGA